ncbi:hypothetical protein ALP69_100914 [Pseudomonas syringae pv. aceris]|nr:hypothetical protein ALP69_100914 [Pseudomonas syringae pv. aceris]
MLTELRLAQRFWQAGFRVMAIDNSSNELSRHPLACASDTALVLKPQVG